MTTPINVNDYSTLHYIAAGSAGVVIGVGVMIIGLAKWGRKLLGIDQIDGHIVVEKECPYAKDHPELQKFMGESIADRRGMRDFLEEINNKLTVSGSTVSNMEGKLDILLRGARVRWNNGLIPEEKK